MPERRSRTVAEDTRASFGLPALDQMLDGGLMSRRPYLLVGPSGTGKTTLALQFLCEGIRRGERVLYITLEDPPNEVKINHHRLGPEVDRIDVFDAIPDVMRYERIPFKDISSVRDVVPFADIPEQIRRTPEFSSVEVTIAALEQMLRTQVARQGYTRLVVDSLTALQYFCMKGFEPVLGAQTFLRFLSELRTTSLLTVEAPLETVETPERMIARGEIRLFRWERDGLTLRAIGVEKLRGSSHDVRMHPYRIGPHGLDINPAVTLARDTREIAEPEFGLSPLRRAGGTEPPATLPGAIFEGIHDLVELGVDVGPLRVEAEAALAEVRAGRPEKSAAHLARLSSLTNSLADEVLRAPAATVIPSPTSAEALRRVAGRVDSSRAGLPPSQVPSPQTLRTELERILSDLPVAPAGRPASAAAATSWSPAGPSAEGAGDGSASSPALSEAGAAAREPTGRDDVLPSAPPPPHPEKGGGLYPRGERTRPEPSAPARPGVPEPPPLPAPATRLPEAPAPASVGAFATGPKKGGSPRQASGERVPPLPMPLPPVSLEEPVAPEVAPTPKPAPRRRRKTTPRSSAAADGAVPAGTETGASRPAAKTRRKVVRRKKAPRVVGATAEPLPPTTDGAPPSSDPGSSSSGSGVP